MSGILPTPLEIKFMGFRNPPSTDQVWQPNLTLISKNESEDNELLEKIKEKKQKLRNAATAAGFPPPSAKTTLAGGYTPVVSTNFNGLSNGGAETPLDNTIAI